MSYMDEFIKKDAIPITSAEQMTRAYDVERWINERISQGQGMSNMDVRELAEYVLGVSDRKPFGK